jgi:hypothetical protein
MSFVTGADGTHGWRVAAMGVIRVSANTNKHNNPGSNVFESTEALKAIVAEGEIKRLADRWEAIQTRINITRSGRGRLTRLRRLIAEGDRLSIMIVAFERFIAKLKQ